MAEPDNLPLFVYGSLRPAELAHHQIACLIDENRTASAELAGYSLWVRDGLPFAARPQHAVPVRGDLLYPKPGSEKDLYRAVRRYEGKARYREDDVDVATAGGPVAARAFLGSDEHLGNPETVLHGDWSARTDPLLTVGMNEIRDELEALLNAQHHEPVPGPAEAREFWKAFVPLQGLYLVLFSVLERYASLVYGTDLGANGRIKSLDADAEAVAAVRAIKPPPVLVVDNRNATRSLDVDGAEPFGAWYLARSNLTHRGKGGIYDYTLIRNATVGLHDALWTMLFWKTAASSARELPPEHELLGRLLAKGT